MFIISLYFMFIEMTWGGGGVGYIHMSYFGATGAPVVAVVDPGLAEGGGGGKKHEV